MSEFRLYRFPRRDRPPASELGYFVASGSCELAGNGVVAAPGPGVSVVVDIKVTVDSGAFERGSS